MKVAIKRKKPRTVHCHQWCFVPQTTQIVKNIGTNAGQKKKKSFSCELQHLCSSKNEPAISYKQRKYMMRDGCAESTDGGRD